MIGIKCFNSHCQGESHKATDKPCQDFSFSIKTEGYTIAMVSDGHGGERYFRSDVGSKIVVEVAHRCLVEFAEGIFPSLFADLPSTSVGIGDIYHPELQRLVEAIVVGWRNAVLEHATANPLNETEQLIANPKDDHEWEKTYGCTLIATLLTPQFWLAFQIGDGKCVVIDKEGVPYEPIPWDDKCFLNKTTSICDTDAASEFRYCIGGKESFPIAVFMGSDGIDDSFGEEENLYNFYIQLAKGFAKDGYDATIADLTATLPVLSKRGSQDDMSVAGWYNERMDGMYEALINQQISMLSRRKESSSKELLELWGNIISKGKGTLEEGQRREAYDKMIRLSRKLKECSIKIKHLRQS
jgi:hypothetical protein